MNGRIGFLTVFILCLFLAGCQKPTGAVPVSGKVTFRGMLLNNGLVVFTPDSSRGSSGPVAMGNINRDGTYTLITDDKLGVQAGSYRITVVSFDVSPSTLPGPIGANVIVPEKYLDPNQSQLSCQVVADHRNNFDIELDPQ